MVVGVSDDTVLLRDGSRLMMALPLAGNWGAVSVGQPAQPPVVPSFDFPSSDEVGGISSYTIRPTARPMPAMSLDTQRLRIGQSLIPQAARLPPGLLVHVSEVVEWEAEYRCFTRNNEVMTLSPYRREGVTFSSYKTELAGPRHELDAASEFAGSVLSSVPCPRAFALDVGIIRGRGWAVVEPNECWGAGIYGCTPSKVLEVLLTATVRRHQATEEDMEWDYAEHYFRACPHMKDHRD